MLFPLEDEVANVTLNAVLRSLSHDRGESDAPERADHDH